MDQIKIRKATKEDMDSIVNFNQQMAMETENKPLDKNTLQEGVTAVFQDPQKGFYLIAEAQGHVVGSLLITREWSDWRNGYFWWIQSVYVRTDMRRKGVFTALYKKVKAISQQRDDIVGFRLYVEKNNKIAQKTYKKIGMKPTYYLLYEETN